MIMACLGSGIDTGLYRRRIRLIKKRASKGGPGRRTGRWIGGRKAEGRRMDGRRAGRRASKRSIYSLTDREKLIGRRLTGRELIGRKKKSDIALAAINYVRKAYSKADPPVSFAKIVIYVQKRGV
jgi:hypothetical protein